MPSENNNANQIIINGEEVINLREDTVSSENLLQGETAHNKAGEPITGDLDPATKDDAYLVSDIEDDIADDDYIPFNDVSDPDIIKKKTLFSSIVTKIKTAFNSVFASITGNNITDKKTFRKNIQTIEFLGIDIPDNADLDTYTTAGNYRVVSDASGATIDNLPLAVCGKVVVFDNGNGGIEQFFLANHSPRIFVRTKFGTDAWTTWKELGEGGDSKAHTYERGTPIPENSDLNSYLTEGVYFIGSDIASQTISNVPVQNAGKLIVVESINSSNYRIQMYQTLTGKMWVRYYSVNEEGWKDWAVISRGTHTYELGTEIPANADLNTYATEGVYKCELTETARTMSNLPYIGNQRVAFKLIVSKIRNSNNIMQTWISYQNNSMAYRTSNDNGTTWNTWTSIYSVINNTIHVLNVKTGSWWSQFKYFINGDKRLRVNYSLDNGVTWNGDQALAFLDDLKAHTYEMGTNIPDNSNLNSYTSEGVYRVATNASAQTMTNIPVKLAGKLVVFNTMGANEYRTQLFMPYSYPQDSRIYMRVTLDSGSIWSSWERFANTKDLIQFSGSAIPANSDLNTYNNTKLGTWYCQLNATVQTISNVPYQVAFKLIVMQIRGVSNLIQWFIPYNDSNCMWWRTTDDNGTNWQSWRTIGQEVLNQNSAREITSGNLNSFTTDGTFYWGASNVSNISNAPFNDSGFMWVMRVFGTQYIRQVAFHRANNNILTRISTDSGSTWTSWGLLYNSVTNSPVTASQIYTGTDTTVRTVRADTLHNGILDTMASATQGVRCVSKIKVFHFSVPDNSGHYKWVKIFDVTEWYNSTTTGQSTRSMSGFVFSDRDNGYMKQEYAWIDLGVAYEKVASQNAGALNLLTTNSNYKPQIIYESSTSKYFLCIRVAGAGRHLEFIGTMYDLTSYNTNLINEWILGTSENQLPSGYSVAIDGSTHQERSCYGVCYTASDQRIKTVDLADPMFKLEVGVSVTVWFNNTNTYSSVSTDKTTRICLNVSNTGSYPIYYNNGFPSGTSTNVFGYASRCITYVFSGDRWIWISGGFDNNVSDHINTRGDVTAETGTTRPAVSGLSMSQAYNNGYPESYGNVMTMKGRGDSQLFIPWSGTSGKAEPLYFRSKRDNTSAEWSSWDKVFSRFFPQVGYAYCATVEATLAKTCSLNTGTWTQYNNSVAIVCFQYNVPANSTLNINGMGAKPITYRGNNITANIIKAGDIALLVYQSDTFRLVATNRPCGLFANYRYADSAGTPSTSYVTINDSEVKITEFSIVRKGDTVMLAMCVKYSTSKTYSTGTKIATLCYSTAQTCYPHDRFWFSGNSLYARQNTFSGNYYLQCTFIVY